MTKTRPQQMLSRIMLSVGMKRTDLFKTLSQRRRRGPPPVFQAHLLPHYSFCALNRFSRPDSVGLSLLTGQVCMCRLHVTTCPDSRVSMQQKSRVCIWLAIAHARPTGLSAALLLSVSDPWLAAPLAHSRAFLAWTAVDLNILSLSLNRIRS